MKKIEKVKLNRERLFWKNRFKYILFIIIYKQIKSLRKKKY